LSNKGQQPLKVRLIEALFNLIEYETLETIETLATGETFQLDISSGDIAQKLNMAPQAVGQILKTLGLQTKPVKIKGSTRRCIVYEKAKFENLKGRYIPSEDEGEVSKVSKVSMPMGLNEIATKEGFDLELCEDEL
jgi:hypothetical protein